MKIYLHHQEEISIKEILEPETIHVNLEETDSTKHESDFSVFTIKELQQQLNDAVLNEDYETAAKVRDEISKRS